MKVKISDYTYGKITFVYYYSLYAEKNGHYAGIMRLDAPTAPLCPKLCRIMYLSLPIVARFLSLIYREDWIGVSHVQKMKPEVDCGGHCKGTNCANSTWSVYKVSGDKAVFRPTKSFHFVIQRIRNYF